MIWLFTTENVLYFAFGKNILHNIWHNIYFGKLNFVSFHENKKTGNS